jgi:hypothetical protein
MDAASAKVAACTAHPFPLLHCPPQRPSTPRPPRASSHVALANVKREYPFHLSHLMRDARDLVAPRALYPVFFGSYDWHSCVHMHWTLARCLRRFAQADLPRPSAPTWTPA